MEASDDSHSDATRESRPVRRDVQALRALAVALVVLWHADVPRVSGGFVGVDVFFVISGFLMTGLLVRELRRSGRLRLGRFYLRRARRLLPAALLVLLATVGLTWWLLPVTVWRGVGWDAVAAGVYVLNWRQAATEVDYLAAESMPSPLQHYWSLGIEEQFYLALPVAILLAAVLMHRLRHRASARAAAAVALLTLAVPSLVWSVLAAIDPSPADYFSTPQRVWELCLGGLLLVATMRQGRRAAPGWRAGALFVGAALILASAVLITPQDAFPGVLALAPCLGAALVLWADSDDLALGRPMGARWVQALGDRSYSLYLWHWPLLVIAIFAAPDHWWARVCAVVLALVLADLTYRFVEQRFRVHRDQAPGVRGPRTGVSVSALAGLTAVAVLAGIGVAAAAQNRPDELTPPLASALDDRFMEFYDGDCRPSVASAEPLTCSFGRQDAGTRVALIGDSTAVMLAPAWVQAAEEHGWRLDLTAKLSCAPVDATINLDGRPYQACRDWSDNVLDALVESPPDLVVLALSPTYQVVDAAGNPVDPPPAALADALQSTLTAITEDGMPVLLLDPPPRFPDPVPECLARDGDDRIDACGTALEGSIPQNDFAQVAGKVPGVELLDLTTDLCPDGWCPPAADGILRYVDSFHLTATYARTLAPLMTQAAADAGTH